MPTTIRTISQDTSYFLKYKGENISEDIIADRLKLMKLREKEKRTVVKVIDKCTLSDNFIIIKNMNNTNIQLRDKLFLNKKAADKLIKKDKIVSDKL